VQVNDSISTKTNTENDETDDFSRNESGSNTLDTITDEIGLDKTYDEEKSVNITEKSNSRIFAEILEIKDIVSRMESEKKISGIEKEEYLSRLREVMQLYEKEKYDEAQLMAEEVRMSLSGNASMTETSVKSEDGFTQHLILVFSIFTAILFLFIIVHNIQ